MDAFDAVSVPVPAALAQAVAIYLADRPGIAGQLGQGMAAAVDAAARNAATQGVSDGQETQPVR